MSTVIHNTEESRFEVSEDGHLAVLIYRLEGEGNGNIRFMTTMQCIERVPITCCVIRLNKIKLCPVLTGILINRPRD